MKSSAGNETVSVTGVQLRGSPLGELLFGGLYKPTSPKGKPPKLELRICRGATLSTVKKELTVATTILVVFFFTFPTEKMD